MDVRMKRHPEVRWSEVARRAIMGYLRRIEEPYLTSSDELLKELGSGFARNLAKISFEKAVKYYERAREAEWVRSCTTRAV